MKKYDAVIIGFWKAGKVLVAELRSRGWNVEWPSLNVLSGCTAEYRIYQHLYPSFLWNGDTRRVYPMLDRMLVKTFLQGNGCLLYGRFPVMVPPNSSEKDGFIASGYNTMYYVYKGRG